MAVRITWNTFIIISIIYLFNHIAYGDENAPAKQKTIASTLNTTQIQKQTNRFLAQFFRKYGSRGIITFEGLEHLMHNLDIGGLEFPEKHTLDQHRQNEYNGNSADNDDDFPTFSSNMMTAELERTTASATVNPATDDYLIKYVFNNTMNNEQQTDVFRTMHDPSHRHPRHRDLKTCLSPISLIQIFNPEAFNNSQKRNPAYRSSLANEHDHQHESVDTNHDEDLTFSNIQITPSKFLYMCPALLLQIEQKSCAEEPKTQQLRGNKTEISRESWILAVVSVTIISLCGLVGVGMVPLTRFTFYQEILRFMIAIAVGTLCGDALMHLLPHALNPHTEASHHNRHATDHHDSHDASVWLFGCAFLTALIMYAIESLLPLIGGSGHGHSHAHQPPSTQSNGQSIEINQNNCHQNNTIERINYGSCEELDNDIETSKRNNEENVMVNDTMNKVRPALTPVAFMVVIGDGLHNLTDGMAIGGAFASDPVTGLATAIAVLCHELPHELGDFALLLQTGVSLRRAIFLNIVSSILCFIGMFVGLFAVSANGDFVRWIYAGTAGTFLYIAFADLVPELNRTKLTAKMAIINILGFLSGGVIMLLIALFEDDIKVWFE